MVAEWINSSHATFTTATQLNGGVLRGVHAKYVEFLANKIKNAENFLQCIKTKHAELIHIKINLNTDGKE